MEIVATLRRFRIGPIAVFDLLAAWLFVFVALAIAYDWRGNRVQHVLISLPIALILGTLAHYLLEIDTPIMRALGLAIAIPVIPP